MKRFVATIAFALVMAAGAAIPALAQYGTTPTNCAGTFNSAGTPTTTFSAGSTIIVRGAAGCSVGGEQVTVTLRSDPVVLGVMAARSDGSYDSSSIGLRIPANTPPGAHPLSVIPNSRRDAPYRTSITVTAAGAGGANLPTTGQAIAIWALWGVIVLIAGYVMASASWRYRRESRRVKQMELDSARNTVPMLAQAAPARPVTPLDPASDPFGDDDSMFLPATPVHTPTRLDDADEPLFVEEASPLLTVEREEPDAVRASVAKSTTRTSDLLAKLHSEIEAWAEK